jgi:hypothetical protein
MNPKPRLQNGVGTEVLCLKSRKDPSQKLYLKKSVHYLYGILAGTTKMKLKFGKILNQERNRLSAAFAEHGVPFCLLEQNFH